MKSAEFMQWVKTLPKLLRIPAIVNIESSDREHGKEWKCWQDDFYFLCS